MDEKELAEYVIKRILDGYVFFVADEHFFSLFKKTSPTVKFEPVNEQVKLRGFKGNYALHFIRKDKELRKYSKTLIKGAGANFETLLGFFFEVKGEIPLQIHVYYTGSGFDFDKMSEMIYSLFTETGENYIVRGQRTVLF